MNFYVILHRYIITNTTGIRNGTFIFHVAQKIFTSVWSTSYTLASVVIPNSNLYLNFIKCIQQNNECNCCLRTSSDHLQGVSVNL